MVVVATGQFDNCAALSNQYGTWGKGNGSLSIGSEGGTNFIRNTIPAIFSEFTFKDASAGDVLDFSQNPTLTFPIRGSLAIYSEFDVVTATGTSQWETASALLPSALVGGQWVSETVDLRQLINEATGQPIDLTRVRRIVLYVQNNNQAVTLDIGPMQASGGVAAQLQASISPAGTIALIQNQTQTFIANVTGGTGPYTLTWLYNDVTPTGETSNTFVFPANIVGSVNLSLSVVDAGGNSVVSNSVAITVNPPGVSTIFDPCDSLTPSNGAWGTTGGGGAAGGALSIRTDSPPQGTGYIRNTIPSSLWSSWTWKRPPSGTVWNFTVNPIVQLRIRSSIVPPDLELVVVTATGPNLWESSSALLPLTQAGQWWQTPLIDLRTIISGTMDLSLVKSLEVYFENQYQAATLDIDDIEVSGGPAPPTTHTLTVAAALGGSTSPAVGSYSEIDGAQVTITAIPDASHNFDYFDVNGTSITVNPYTITMTADFTVTPVFTPIAPITRTLTISSLPSNGGTTSPAAGSYSEANQAQVTITATPNSGFQLTKWTVDGQDYNPAALTISSAAGGSTTPAAGTYQYTVGQVVPVTAMPSPNYVFTNWVLDGVNAGTSSTINVTMTGDRVLIPIFTYQAPQSGALHVTGDQILDSNNNPFRFVGVGLGGIPPQLVIWGPGSSDNYAWAPSTAIMDQTFQCLRDVWHVNKIRFFFYPEWYWRDTVSVPGQYPTAASTRTFIKTLCTEAAKYGIYVDLVPYQLTASAVSFASDPYLSPAQGGAQGIPGVNWDAAGTNFLSAMGYSGREMQFWNDLWTLIANDLKSFSNVIFEAWNEADTGTSPNTIPAGYLTYLTTMYNAIRNTGATNLIFMQWQYSWIPNGWGQNLSWCAQIRNALPNATNLAFTTHMYYYAPADGSSYWLANGITHAAMVSALQSAKQSMGVTAPLVINEAGDCPPSLPPAQNDLTWWDGLCYAAKNLGIGITAYYWATPAGGSTGGTGWANEAILSGPWQLNANSPPANQYGTTFMNYGGV